MLFRKKTKPATDELDDIPEKIHKRLHVIYFFIKCVLTASIILFFWTTVCIYIFDLPELDSDDSPFLHHEYCGTFYIEVNRENSFASQEAFDAYIHTESHSISVADIITFAVMICTAAASIIMLAAKKLPRFMSKRAAALLIVYPCLFLFAPDIAGSAHYFGYILLLLALRSGDKKTVFSKSASTYFLLFGAVWLASDVIKTISLNGYEKALLMTGVLSHPTYYCHFYRITAIPFIAVCAGLMLRRRELDLKNADTSKNSSCLKMAGIALIAGAAGFVLYRLPVRIYEVIKVMTDSSYSVKVPLTVMDTHETKLVEMPRELANTPEIYQNTVIFRFVKDAPVFLLSCIAVWSFAKVLFALSRGELNTRSNRKCLNISIVILLAASLWVNLMGFPELNYFNNGFTGIFGEVVYTMALRSLTEPALYAMVLWFFKTYLQTIPETAE